MFVLSKDRLEHLRLGFDHAFGFPTFVGEAPSQKSDPKRPFVGPSGDRLATWSGLASFEELERRAYLRNVLQKWPGPGNRGEKGSKFPAAMAKQCTPNVPLTNVVVLVGARVAKAFGMAKDRPPPFTWTPLGGDLHRAMVVAAWMPHPSGTNRFFNDPKNRVIAARFLRTLFPRPAR